jgi:hypothetical protein
LGARSVDGRADIDGGGEETDLGGDEDFLAGLVLLVMIFIWNAFVG